MLKTVIGVCVACLFVPTILCLSEEMMELGRQLHKDCQEQSGADEAIIDTVVQKQGFPDDEKLKCYMKCLMSEMAVIDDDGVLDVEAAIAVIPEEMKDVAEPVIRKCGVITGANACDSSYLIHKCWYEADPKNYFIV